MFVGIFSCCPHLIYILTQQEEKEKLAKDYHEKELAVEEEKRRAFENAQREREALERERQEFEAAKQKQKAEMVRGDLWRFVKIFLCLIFFFFSFLF